MSLFCIIIALTIGDCGGEGWTRIAYLNMSDPSQNCPQGWNLATYSTDSGTVRACHRDVLWPQPQCDTVTFPTGNEEYSQVCGRAIGYQIGSTQAFSGTFVRFGSPQNETVIDGYYIDGFILSHGPPGSRQHIWSFVTGNSEDDPGSSACPCAPNATDVTVPSFVGSNYFCESGRVYDTGRPGYSHLFFNDPLWDGQGCHLEGNTCCTFNSPPYFSTQLPEPTTDDILASICAVDNLVGTIDDTRINFLEIYVK